MEFTKLIGMQNCIRETLGLFEVEGVHSTHDASEGGLAADLNDRTEASVVGFEVEMESAVWFLLK